ncbi:MAG: hypothetical protein CMQ36_11685 [Gammaproteobacteria bacterium]|nr:hypothetical protein [Gammaproteobacteria bacterium]MCH2352189.1 LLM class flavin-dependent oxidoreductase [Pseudomonadales bacterium]HAO55857.1 hypothetical protein [Gammaproteobacteria bacterium]
MTGPETSMGVTFGSLGILGPRAIGGIAEHASTLGYRSIWTVEANGTDAFTLLAAASVNQPTLGLGTGIVPIQLRTPSLTAMTAASLQALSPDADIFVGLGVSAPAILRQHGVSYPDKPIALMREYVALLRECLSGESVTFEGDYWTIKRFRLGIRLNERKPQIVMAALNPQMLKLAGEIADGVLLNYVPVSHVVPSVEQVRKGGNARIFAYVHAAVGSLEKSAKSAKRDLFNYSMADSYAAMFRRAGFETEIASVRERMASRDRDGAIDSISHEMIQSIDFIGAASEVRKFVQDYIDAGVEYPILMPMPWGEDRLAVTKATMEAGIGD